MKWQRRFIKTYGLKTRNPLFLPSIFVWGYLSADVRIGRGFGPAAFFSREEEKLEIPICICQMDSADLYKKDKQPLFVLPPVSSFFLNLNSKGFTPGQ